MASLSLSRQEMASRIAQQIVQDPRWTLRQHSIDSIVDQFDPETGLPRTQSHVTSWPTLLSKPKSFVKDMATNLIPPRRGNRGVHNLLDEDSVIEAQIEEIPGYVVETDYKSQFGASPA